jgi:hypothetical protein
MPFHGNEQDKVLAGPKGILVANAPLALGGPLSQLMATLKA